MQVRNADSQARIEALEERLGALEAATGLATQDADLLSDEDQATLRGRGDPRSLQPRRYGDTVALQTEGPAGAADAVAVEEPDRKTPAPSEAVETVTEVEQGIFGDRLSFEAGVTYSHFDDAQINLSGFLALDAIFLGRISLDEITADVITTEFVTRYGLTDRLQFDVSVPYLFRHSNFQSAGAGGSASGTAEVDVTGSGLGDISVGASYRLLRETFRRPDVVLNARVKAPTGEHPFGVELVEIPGTAGNLKVPERLSTGSGVWGASAGISVLKTLDPMVVFGSLTYFYNFSQHFRDIDEALGNQPGSTKIGDAIQYGAGVAFALNERSSLSLSFTQRFGERTTIRRDGGSSQVIVGSQSNVGLFNVGATFSLSDKIALLTNLGVGMTSDAPDMVLSVRVPFRF
ncbi:transporter [Allosphingosinicella sp.]|uniref:transporter n=1 Tax=Allosphingosinicella sp. TaxID=2823234 RepID=UPI002FC25C20